MTVTRTGIPTGRFMGETGDTKPTKTRFKAGTIDYDVPHGSTFYETDTGVMWITADGDTWVEKDTIVRLETSPTIDIGDVQIKAGEAVGEVTASPTANTILGRLKAIEDGAYSGPATGLSWTNVFYAKHNIYSGACKLYMVIFWAVQNTTEYAKINNNTDFGASNLIVETWATQYAPMTIMDFMSNPIPFSTGLSVSYMKDPWNTHLGMKICYKPD